MAWNIGGLPIVPTSSHLPSEGAPMTQYIVREYRLEQHKNNIHQIKEENIIYAPKNSNGIDSFTSRPRHRKLSKLGKHSAKRLLNAQVQAPFPTPIPAYDPTPAISAQDATPEDLHDPYAKYGLFVLVCPPLIIWGYGIAETFLDFIDRYRGSKDI